MNIDSQLDSFNRGKLKCLEANIQLLYTLKLSIASSAFSYLVLCDLVIILQQDRGSEQTGLIRDVFFIVIRDKFFKTVQLSVSSFLEYLLVTDGFLKKR